MPKDTKQQQQQQQKHFIEIANFHSIVHLFIYLWISVVFENICSPQKLF